MIEENIHLDNLRTITVANGKVKEAFPFDSSTFFEISNKLNITKEEVLFENSKFEKELSKPIHLFIFTENDIFYQEIDFKGYLENAEFVFNETVDAFKTADEEKFPKSSLEKDFHIRPKAANSDDVMLLSEGIQITKRTFWANRGTMNEIIYICNNKENEQES